MAAVDYIGEGLLRVGDVTFSYGVPPSDDVSAEILGVFKSRALIDELVRTLDHVRPERIVELGVFRGGSAGLIALLTRPEKMVALELAAEPIERLRALLEREGLMESVVPYYGVDQGDSRRLGEILDSEFGDRPIDLVIDDASHLYAPSRRSFELIFPRLRCGGVYIVEDWAAHHTLGATIIEGIVRRAPGWEGHVERLAASVAKVDGDLAEDVRRDPQFATLVAATRRQAAAVDRPLSRLGLELVHVAAESRDIVRRVNFTQAWIEIERGEGELSGEHWLDTSSMDLFGSLSTRA